MSSRLFHLIVLISLVIQFKCLNLDDILKKVQDEKKKKISVAGSDNEHTLESIRKAKDLGIADFVIVGNEELLKNIASDKGIDISDLEVINMPDDVEASRYAVKLVHDRKADIFMKGSVESKLFLQAILDKKIGLRTGKKLSAIAIVEMKDRDKLLFLSDPAVRPYPTLEDKAAIIENALYYVHNLGILNPKVAILAAVEKVNPKLKENVEADILRKMGEEGKFPGSIVDGPLSLDLSLDPIASKLKKSNRKIQGDADLLIFPDATSGNIAYKIFSHVLNWRIAHILAGTSAPCILTSRSDTSEVKFNSILLAVHYDNLKYNSKGEKK